MNIIDHIERLLAQGVTHALTLWPEWQFPIKALGDKRVENRSWAPPEKFIGQTIALHWGAHIGGRKGNLARLDGCQAMLFAARHAGWLQRGVGAWSVELTRGDRTEVFDADALVTSAIDTIIRITSVTRPSPQRADDPYYTGECGWRFDVVEKLSDAIPCKGAQGLWPLRSLLGQQTEQPQAGRVWS